MYAYQRPYLLIEGGAEYTAVNLRGDCGLQALLFITLCRISGASPRAGKAGCTPRPAMWAATTGRSFTATAWAGCRWIAPLAARDTATGSQLRWRFYFGNLDPWRMVANRSYYAPFSPLQALCALRSL